jgi:hypothetical protein
MEHQLWKLIVALMTSLDTTPPSTRLDFSDHRIVGVYFWAVIHDRPTSWACHKEHWPPPLRKRTLPSPATMSRRLRSPGVMALLDAIAHRVVAPKQPGLFWMLDGKPLPISGCSKDRQAGYGRAAGGKAKGYKIHAIIGSDGTIGQWCVAPMNKDERVMAERLVKRSPPEVAGYLLGDGNYDSNPLHKKCEARGNLQMVTPRRYGAGKGTGHRKQTAGRLRSMAIVESPFAAFGDQLRLDRSEIERQYGNLTNWGGGLTCLPAWVRTHRRVHRWIQAKMVLTKLKGRLKIRTYAA